MAQAKKKKKNIKKHRDLTTPRKTRMSFSQIVFYGFGALVILSMLLAPLLSN